MSDRLGEVGMTGGKVIENMIRIAGEVPYRHVRFAS